MDESLEPFLPNILSQLGADNVLGVDKMQSLWSDYGAIYRVGLEGCQHSSVVVKSIRLQAQPNHPRGWASTRSHDRKLKSYQIENHWYEHFAGSLPANTKVPELLYCAHQDGGQVLVLEDLSAAYPNLNNACDFNEAKAVVGWLARFHAHFVNHAADGLWSAGSYWHLDTRPEEWEAMEDSQLKEKARQLDDALSQAKYKTIIHGDAKVANFCFGQINQVAAVDFQYVGKGIGVIDLAYFIGSCFTDYECQLHEKALVDAYFEQLGRSIKELTAKERSGLEQEWRALYPVAWADFNRFLMGWLPSHQKLHGHALSKNEEAFKYLEGE